MVIANAFGYPDALAGAPLAAQHDAPSLLTGVTASTIVSRPRSDGSVPPRPTCWAARPHCRSRWRLTLDQSPHAGAWTDDFACEFTRVTLTGGEAAVSPQVDASLLSIVDRKCGPPDVNITGVVADPEGRDDAFDGGEYLTVRNDGDADAFLSGGFVLDAADTRLNWCDSGLVLGASARLYSGQGNDGPDHCHAGSNRSVFNNEGDTLRLYDADDNLVDAFSLLRRGGSSALLTGALALYSAVRQPGLQRVDRRAVQRSAFPVVQVAHGRPELHGRQVAASAVYGS